MIGFETQQFAILRPYLCESVSIYGSTFCLRI